LIPSAVSRAIVHVVLRDKRSISLFLSAVSRSALLSAELDLAGVVKIALHDEKSTSSPAAPPDRAPQIPASRD
jgi:hypothetical protein